MKVIMILWICAFVLVSILSLVACDGACATATYKYATISLPTGEIIEGPVEKWTYGSSGICSITINGIRYRTHMENIVIVEGVGEQ